MVRSSKGLIVLAGPLLLGCGGCEPFEENVDIAVCDPSESGFTAEITNEFFPMPIGKRLVLEGKEGGATVRVEISALDETELVAGVETRVIEERESEDGEIVEISRNFFVQAADGTLCYYGEDVDDYEDGAVTGHGGAWRAGEEGAVPGILMPATVEVGQMYRQEIAEGVAEDRARHTDMGERIETPYATYTDTLTVDEDSPIEPGATSHKVYARGVGLVFDDGVELVDVVTP